VSIEPLDTSVSSTNYQNVVGMERLQIITLRHPQWTANDPYKDIPLMVYTHKQWNEEVHERLGNTHAGGFIIELWHNQRYVFGLPNRWYTDDRYKGVEEAVEIVEQNRYRMPPLYPEKP